MMTGVSSAKCAKRSVFQYFKSAMSAVPQSLHL